MARKLKGPSERPSFALKYELRAIGIEGRPDKKDRAKSWTRRERGRSGTGESLGAQPSGVATSLWGLRALGWVTFLHPHSAL